MTELEDLPDNVSTFVSVGRLYVIILLQSRIPSFISLMSRFVAKSLPSVKAEITESNAALEDDLGKLETSRSHLERTFNEHKESLTEMVRQKA